MNKVANKLIPNLRFPEFVNEGEWVKRSIDSVGDVVTGGTPSKEDKEYWGGEFVWVTAQDFKEKYIIDSVLKITQKGKDKSRVIPENSVLVTCIASIGLNGINKVECATNQQINSVICNNKNHFEFIYYAISHNISRLKDMAGQTAVPIISKSIFEKFTIHTPQTTQEQQKVASCLSSLDEVISTHSKKLGLLKDHKKGLMQNLFPQEGETVPKYRFPEFVNDGEWKQTPLDDICKLVRGPFGGSLKKEIFVKDGYAVYEQSHAIYSDFSFFRYYIDDEKFSELKRFSVKSGDLIMSCSGTMGKFAIIPHDYKVGVINQALLKLTVKKGYDNIFVKMTLEAENNQNKLLSQSAGGAIKNVVSVSQIKELGLFIPSLNEQQKIAECLSSLDALITAQAEKIEQLKLHKKGLMQGLFPKVNG